MIHLYCLCVCVCVCVCEGVRMLLEMVCICLHPQHPSAATLYPVKDDHHHEAAAVPHTKSSHNDSTGSYTHTLLQLTGADSLMSACKF